MVIEGIGEVVQCFVLGFGYDVCVDGVGMCVLVVGVVVVFQLYGDFVQVVVGGLVYCVGVGVYFGVVVEFLQVGIGYVVQGEGLFVEGFEVGEGVCIIWVLQVLVEEQLCGCQYDVVVDIVLVLYLGQIVVLYWVYVVVVGQVGDFIFVQFCFEFDVVQWLQCVVGCGQVEDVVEELFYCVCGVEVV